MDLAAIITNRVALRTKYGESGLKRIDAELKRYISASESRDVEARVYDISDPGEMAVLGEKPVPSATAARLHKIAVDAICAADSPAYVILLGGPDVIPHQSLKHTVEGDPDDDVPSDLPYACDAPYSRDIEKFIGPTRVVGRIPDIAGSDDPEYLIGLIANSRKHEKRPSSFYRKYFGISAEAWKHSSRRSVSKLFGTTKDMELVPPEDEEWPSSLLERLSHFINCHGDIFDPFFYGENENDQADQPNALISELLTGEISVGSIVATECCYGALLYEPEDSESSDLAICNRYLQEGAYAFVGSTNIAYGPAKGNAAADYICQFFLDHTLDGASSGRALLEARHRFVRTAAPMSPVDYKTLGQFLLLGDPTIHPVSASKPSSKTKNALRDARLKQRDKRRKLLRKAGRHLARTTVLPDATEPKLLSLKKRTEVLSHIETVGIEPSTAITLAMSSSADGAVGPKAKLRRQRPAACHVITGRLAEKKDKVLAKGKSNQERPKVSWRRKRGAKHKKIQSYLQSGVLIIAKEVQGQLDRVEELRPH